jgi:hypothetical protein
MILLDILCLFRDRMLFSMRLAKSLGSFFALNLAAFALGVFSPSLYFPPTPSNSLYIHHGIA